MFGDENKKYQTNYTTSKEKNMQRAEKKLCSKQKRISAFSYLCAFFVREQHCSCHLVKEKQPGADTGFLYLSWSSSECVRERAPNLFWQLSFSFHCSGN